MSISLEKIKESRLTWYAITTLIFAILIYSADFRKFLNTITSVRPGYMILAIAFGLSVFLIWSLIWYRSFKQVGIDASYIKSLKIFLAGNFMNSVTPLGQFGGEPIMGYIVSKNTGTSYEESLSTVISSDLINASPFITYLIGGLIYLFLFSTLENLAMQLLYLAIAVTAFGALLAHLLWFEKNILKNTLLKLLRFAEDHTNRGEKYLESLESRIIDFMSAFRKVGEDPIHLTKSIVISHLAFLTNFIALYFVLLSQGIEPQLTPIYFTVILSGVASLSPTPGGSGTFETIFAGLMLIFYPIGLDAALATAVLYRLTTYWPGIPIGYISLISLRRSRDQ